MSREPGELERGFLDFADAFGRHLARRHGVPPVTGRLAGWLLVCDPPVQTAAQLAASLHTSRSAVGASVAQLEALRLARRVGIAGARAAGVRAAPITVEAHLAPAAECLAVYELATSALEMLRGAEPARRGRLRELAAFHAWLLGRLPALGAEWNEGREVALRTEE